MNPFSHDTLLRDEVVRTMRANEIDTFVETGTYLGETSGWMALEGFRVWTIELDLGRARDALARFGHLDNWSLIRGSSSLLLPLLTTTHKFESALFYLDAHWNEEWPILDELRAISHCERGVIVVHDFKVPGHPELGYDTYGAIDLDIDFIKPILDEHFRKWWIRYHEKAAGRHQRGACFIQFDNS